MEKLNPHVKFDHVALEARFDATDVGSVPRLLALFNFDPFETQNITSYVRHLLISPGYASASAESA
jgi:hypothetical protein